MGMDVRGAILGQRVPYRWHLRLAHGAGIFLSLHRVACGNGVPCKSELPRLRLFKSRSPVALPGTCISRHLPICRQGRAHSESQGLRRDASLPCKKKQKIFPSPPLNRPTPHGSPGSRRPVSNFGSKQRLMPIACCMGLAVLACCWYYRRHTVHYPRLHGSRAGA